MHNPNSNDVHDQGPDKDQKPTPAEKDKAEEHDEDMLDETIDESFPASDPPANY